MKNIVYLLALVSLSGCYMLNPSVMLRTGKNYQYNTYNDSLSSSKEYKISPNDIVDFRIYSNDGFKLIDFASISSNSSNNAVVFTNVINYTVEPDGNVKLPLLGKTKIAGMTVREAELMLEEKYSAYYIKPFAIVKVINKRIIIFPGNAGTAKVLPLTNNNTTLIEALALAGGLSQSGKARKIKLIRGDLQNPQVYLIDLSTISGIKQADMILQENDVIYVEPRLYVTREFLAEISPILSLLTSLLLAYTLLRRA